MSYPPVDVPTAIAVGDVLPYDPNEAPPPVTPGRRNAARAVIVLSGLVTLAAFVAIYYRSFAVMEPTSAVVVIGDPSLDGAEIIVQATALSPPNFTEARATLSADNHFKTPVLLRPGEYHITVTLKDQRLMSRKFRVQAYRLQEYLLGKAAEDAAAAEQKAAARRNR